MGEEQIWERVEQLCNGVKMWNTASRWSKEKPETEAANHSTQPRSAQERMAVWMLRPTEESALCLDRGGM